ncbi:MAG: TAT-variant-translocated molybdopterin oxidoreductase [Pirellula sp.]|jgi:molybdopterin-containing oxidoreductase family iron-sulfur binding subunit|nr:TAT-variant-translocated molybdopterin oxidoreductase [Pirellula sp.]
MSLTGQEHQQRYFRSIDELQQTPEFQQFVTREFPQAASEFPEGVSRRRWIQMMGASLALGGVAGCRYHREEIGAFVVRPEGRVPGIPEYFATNFEWAGSVVNALIANLEGRPLKVDGNPDHPAYANSQPKNFTENKKLRSAGTTAITQASILSLYDQDRIANPLLREKLRSSPKKFSSEEAANKTAAWDAFSQFIEDQKKVLAGTQGEGLAILFEPTQSPSLRRALADAAAMYPKAKLVKYESVYTGKVSKALESVGAAGGSIGLNLDAAKVIVSLDADLFGADANSVHNARQFANHRSPDGEWVNRLYVIESQYSVTGSAADFRLALQSRQIAALLKKIESAIDAGTVVEDKIEDTYYNKLDDAGKVARVIECIASDLLSHKGESALCVGSHLDLNVQLAALRINQKLGNLGKTVNVYVAPNELADVGTMKLDDFVNQASSFKSVWILANNPVFTVPGDLALAAAIEKIPDSVYLGNHDDETAELCKWTVPAAHPFEVWGDVRNVDGTYGVGQPLIDPLLDSKSPIEFLAMLAGLPVTSGQQYVMETAKAVSGGTLSERVWKETLHSGFLAGSALISFAGELTFTSAATEGDGVAISANELPDGEITLGLDKKQLEVVLRPSDTVYDGRLANNGWLQECPQPITKLTWDNAAICSIGTARELGLKQGELASLRVGESNVLLPVFVVPGHAEGSFTVNLGYGRAKGKAGINGSEVGTNLSSFRRWNQASVYTSVEVKNTTTPYPLATTQDHFAIEDEGGMRENAKRAPALIREGTFDEFKTNSNFAFETVEHHFENKSLWEEPKVDLNHKWGMAIDLNKCIGCNACVVACQSENNVPIVGKEQVRKGREMHWLRLDRYFTCDMEATQAKGSFKDPVDPTIVTQPMMCSHCETAPCEQVCPVAATVHTEEGINAMAYNRCIGTRYCGNNCPTKVRRFNYFSYVEQYGYNYGWTDNREKASAKLQSLVLNPEVTVRGRGVMEKCTYCIQRVQNGKIHAKTKGDGRVHDGDVITACQQACPTQAIVFGDLHDKTSRVYKSHNDPRAYAVLEELNIKPRTLYLAKIRNVPKRLQTATQVNPHRPGDEAHGHSDDHSHESGDHGHHS